MNTQTMSASTRRDLLAEGVLSTRALLARYLAGFDDASAVRQGPSLPNHVKWNLGHCALTTLRCGEKLGAGAGIIAGALEGGFVAGVKGDARRFGLESVSFGSAPTADAASYPSLERSVEIYNAACEAFAGAMRQTPDADLDREVQWGPSTIPVWAVAQRMIYHNGFHTGQIADLRRAFGFKSIFA